MKDFSPLNEKESSEQEYSSKVSDENKIHIERIVSLLPVPYYWGWIIIASAFFIISNIFIIFFERSTAYILSCFILSVLLAQQCIIIMWTKNKISLIEDILLEIVDLPEEKILSWWKDRMSNICNDKKMAIMGILMNIGVHIVHLDDFGYPYNTIYSHFFIQYSYYIVHYFMGAGVYFVFATALSVYSISRLPLNINVFLSKHLQFKGLLYSKLTLCAISAYLSWGTFYMTTPNRISSLSRMLWFASFAIVIIIYFILPQYSIHQMIAKAKSDNLEAFTLFCRSIAKEVFQNPNKNNIRCLRTVIDIQRQIDEMSAWPFGTYEILHILLIIIIPLAVVVLELELHIIKFT